MVYYSIVLVPSTHLVKTVGIDLLRAWYDVIDLDFIIYLMIFFFTFIYPYSIYCTLWVFPPSISYIVHDLVTLRVAQKIWVMGPLQVDDLFAIDSWT